MSTVFQNKTTPSQAWSEKGMDASSDQNFWHRVCLPAISGLLDQAGTYTEEEKREHLSFVAKYATAWLGNERHTIVKSPQNPLQVSSALETSINFSSHGKPIVRFQFEPIAATVFARTTDDPFGRRATLRMLEETKQLASEVDLRWTEQLIDAFYPSAGHESTILLSKERELPPPLDHAPMFNFAFDMEGGQRKMKTYFLPIGKVLATGQASDAITFGAIRSLRPHGAELDSIVKRLEDYFSLAPEALTIDLVGLDASDPASARIKVYAHMQSHNSWETVTHVCTFGGLAKGKERLEGLDQLRSIWHLLLDEQTPIDTEGSKKTHKEPHDPASFLGTVMFSFEMRAADTFPLVKTYVPVWQYAASDQKIARNLSACFRTLGWAETADSYEANLQRTYPGADLSGAGPALLHSNISFSYTEKTGAYMSIYYAVSAKSVNADKH